MKPRRMVMFRLRLDAPADRVWAAVTDHAAMSDWLGVRRSTLSRAGATDPNGLGAERTLVDALAGTVVERVIDWRPVESYRYCIVSDSPFLDHLGEMRLAPQDARTTDLVLTIRFRPRWPGTGWLLQQLLNAKLRAALKKLKALVEAG